MIENITGILQPQLQNRWKLQFELDEVVGIQAIECSIDYVNKFLHFTVEQPVENGESMHRLFYNLATQDEQCKMSVITMDGEGNETTKITVNGNLLSHFFGLDYASSASARHRVSFSFTEVESFEKEIPTLKGTYVFPNQFE